MADVYTPLAEVAGALYVIAFELGVLIVVTLFKK